MKDRWWSLRDSQIGLNLAPRVASALMRAGARTLRRLDVNRGYADAVWEKRESGIVTFWHGRLLMMPFGYPGQTATILISQHRDGEYITRIAQRLGFLVERGSATRGGARAFRQLVYALKEGRNVAVTPDGPKGPARRVKSGVIELSRLSGKPILPVGCGAWPCMFLRSWDRFMVPSPFARIVYVWAPPLTIPSELSKVEAERFQDQLASVLDAVTAEADRRAKAHGER